MPKKKPAPPKETPVPVHVPAAAPAPEPLPVPAPEPIQEAPVPADGPVHVFVKYWWHRFFRYFGLDKSANLYFWTLFLFTHMYVWCIWREFLKYGPSPSIDMREMYIMMVIGYSAWNKFFYWDFLDERIKKPGDIMVVFWALTSGTMYLWHTYDETTAIPRDIFSVTNWVWGIYLGSESIDVLRGRKDWDKTLDRLERLWNILRGKRGNKTPETPSS